MLPSCLPARTFIPPPRPRPVETGGRRSRNNRLRQRPLTRCQRRLTVRGVARAFRPAPAARTKPRGRRSRARLRGPQNEIYGCSPAPGQRRKGVGFVVPSCALATGATSDVPHSPRPVAAGAFRPRGRGAFDIARSAEPDAKNSVGTWRHDFALLARRRTKTVEWVRIRPFPRAFGALGLTSRAFRGVAVQPLRSGGGDRE